MFTNKDQVPRQPLCVSNPSKSRASHPTHEETTLVAHLRMTNQASRESTTTHDPYDAKTLTKQT